MKSTNKSVLTINGGSSSIRFALYEIEDSLKQFFFGEIENIGRENTSLNFNNVVTHKKNSIAVSAASYNEAADFLISWLTNQAECNGISAIGHRIVHGMKHSEPELISDELLSEFRNISAYDPEHMPGAIKLIELFQKHYPTLPQIACFDTAFHTSMPAVAKLLSIPRRFNANGIQRYGFHGISYSYILEEFSRIAGNEAANGRIVMAHLGNGASLVAIKDGKSRDTSMGFTPASGIPMGTRAGDLDPGVAWYLMQAKGINAEQFSHLINHESGLLGISETSADMRELLKQEATDSRAAEAIELFCYQTTKWIGSFAAVLGGIDTLIFSGGIGENAPEIRNRVCRNFQFLGIELDELKNVQNEGIISINNSTTTVHVIKTDEQIMIARLVCQVLNYTFEN